MAQESTTEEGAAPALTHPAVLAWGWPLWLAVTFTVFLTWPFGVYLGDYNLPLYVTFVVWVEYFVFGAKPSALKIMIPNFVYGSVTITIGTLLYLWIHSWEIFTGRNNVYLSLSIAYFIVIGALVWGMNFNYPFANNPLPVFNGVAITLGVFFTGSYWPLFENVYASALIACVATIAAGLLGGIAAFFNVAITGSRKAAH